MVYDPVIVIVSLPTWGRSDGRFGEISAKLIDYDFDTAGAYTGRELDAALDMIRAMAHGQRNHDHAILLPTSGQSVIIGADEAAELLPNLTQAVERARA